MTEIIVADLVPLRERGKFGGIIGAVSASRPLRNSINLSGFVFSCMTNRFGHWRLCWVLLSAVLLHPPDNGGGFFVRIASGSRLLLFLTYHSDLNLPLSAVAATLVFCFLRMKTPQGKTSDKLKQIDWM